MNTTATQPRICGIDISKYQTARGKIDFSQVKAGGNEFVLVRVGWAGYAGELHLDPHLDTVIRDIAAAGLHVGLYVYTYNVGEGAARVTAREMVAFAEKYKGMIDYPLCYDVEETTDKCLISQGKEKLTATILAFCDEVKKLRYFPMWYTYTAFVQQYLIHDRLKEFDFWQADYRATPWVCERGAWQYIGDKGRCPGVIGACDNNYSYNDYARIIREGGWNSFKSSAPAPELPPTQGETVSRKEYEALSGRYEEIWAKYDALAGKIKGLAAEL